MAIQYVNTGSGANAGDGDSLRTAFYKINNNFAELSALSGTDTSVIIVNSFPPTTSTEGTIWYDTVSGRNFIYYDGFWVDAAPPAVEPINFTTVTSHIFPGANLTYDLGSTSSQWRSLYVGTGTIYIGGVPITVNQANNTLIVGATPGTAPTTATSLATESFVIDYVTQNGGGGSSSLNTNVVTINDINTGNFQNTGSIAVAYTAFSGDYGVNFSLDYQLPLTTSTGISVLGIKFPDSTIQTTAFTGTSALLDITNTNGIDTTYYLTFVENRTNDQIVRADVDLTFNSWSNTLGVGNVTATNTINAGGILFTGRGIHEKFTTSTTATTTTTYDCSTTQLFYHSTTGTVANWTANFINLNLEDGRATSVSIIINQGNTGYYPSAIQIGGVGQTLNWQGNTTPTVSSNRNDVITFSILNNSGSYLVLGQVTGF